MWLHLLWLLRLRLWLRLRLVRLRLLRLRLRLYYTAHTDSNGFYTGDSSYAIAWMALGNRTACVTVALRASRSHTDLRSAPGAGAMLSSAEHSST